jgi:hypothetical protein
MLEIMIVLNVKNDFITDIISQKMEVLYVIDAEKFVGLGYLKCHEVGLGIQTSDGVTFYVVLYVLKKWLLKMQKSMVHNPPKFCYTTDGGITKIDYDRDTLIIRVVTGSQTFSLQGQLWFDRFKDVVDNILQQIE